MDTVLYAEHDQVEVYDVITYHLQCCLCQMLADLLIWRRANITVVCILVILLLTVYRQNVRDVVTKGLLMTNPQFSQWMQLITW